MKSILAADIGGTHSRFAHFTMDPGGALTLVETRWIETRRATSFSHLLNLLQQMEFSLPVNAGDAAVFAVAGPIVKGVYSNPPNIAWGIDVSDSAERLQLQRCFLINDFTAQAYACRTSVVESAQKIVPGEIDPSAALAVIGAGTGLGMAALLPDGAGGYVAVPSEGGHGAFAFETSAELDFMKFLMDESGGPYVETEWVVSGRGLSRVHQFLCGEKLEPAEIAAGLTRDSETLRWMARFYGRACRNYALQVLARGGVYIAGGVAAKTPELVTHPEFRQQFRSSKTMGSLLDEIPVFLNSNEESGLWGAAFFGALALRSNQKS
jgi:glucokinase